VHFAFRALLNFTLELVDFRALRPMIDSRTRGEQANHKFVGGALDVDRADPGGTQLILQLLAQRNVLVQQVGINRGRRTSAISTACCSPAGIRMDVSSVPKLPPLLPGLSALLLLSA